MRRVRRVLPGAAVVVLASTGWLSPLRPHRRDDGFTIIVFTGEQATVHLPLLAALPAFGRDAAGALMKQHNAKARELTAHLQQTGR